MSGEPERLMTALEVAELLGFSAGTILDWWEAGKLPGFRCPGGERGKLRFRRSEIEATLESWRDGPVPPAKRSSLTRLEVV